MSAAFGACSKRSRDSPGEAAGDRQHVHLRERLEVRLRAPAGPRRPGTRRAWQVCMPSAAAPAMSVASVSPTKSVRSGATPSRSSARSKISRVAACAGRPRRRRRRRRGARRRPARSRSRCRSSGGSKAFETSPSFSPRPRSDSSSACVVDASWRAGAPGGVLGLEEAVELVVVDLDVELAEQSRAPAPGTRSPRAMPGLEEAGEVDVAEARR